MQPWRETLAVSSWSRLARATEQLELKLLEWDFGRELVKLTGPGSIAGVENVGREHVKLTGPCQQREC